MLKIQRAGDSGITVFALSGRIEQGHVAELQQILDVDADGEEISLDLEEVRLVDREAVQFLAACEARGIKLTSCPSYIRQWISKGTVQAYEP